MSDSSVQSIFSRVFDPENELHLLAAASEVLPPPELGKRRLLTCVVPNGESRVEVWVSWEAQCAIAGTTELTTDEILERHAPELYQQLALMIASRPAPKNDLWTFDACDVVPII